MKTFLTVDPWDLMDPDAGAMLDRFSGELGATGLTVNLAMPPTVRLRLMGHEPRVIQTRGGLFVHTADDGFELTRLKPIVASYAPRRDWLTQARTDCQDRGLALRASFALSSLGRVAQRHREMACRNVFGATSRESICLSNPDVQAFFTTLLSVITDRTSFDGVTLTDGFFGWTEAFGPASLTSASLGSVDRAMLSICFCESCLQSASDAGVDVMSARRSVEVMLDASLDRDEPTERTLASVLSDNEPLQAYVTWRGHVLSALWSRMAKACRCDLVIDVSGSCADTASGSCHEATIAAMPFGDVDYKTVGGVMCLAAPSGGSVPGKDGDCPDHPPFDDTVSRRELRIPSSLCTGNHGPQLVTLMSKAAESGVGSVQVDGGASLPGSALDSVRQAIRFVRRSA